MGPFLSSKVVWDYKPSSYWGNAIYGTHKLFGPGQTKFEFSEMVQDPHRSHGQTGIDSRYDIYDWIVNGILQPFWPKMPQSPGDC